MLVDILILTPLVVDPRSAVGMPGRAGPLCRSRFWTLIVTINVQKRLRHSGPARPGIPTALLGSTTKGVKMRISTSIPTRDQTIAAIEALDLGPIKFKACCKEDGY